MVASVVPPLDYALAEMARRYFHTDAVFVGPETDTGLKVRYDNPREVGADRVVDAAAAYRLFGGPACVVDFGTATTFDAISRAGNYLGGAIAPGIGISADALFERTARLPRVDIRKPQRIIGSNTERVVRHAPCPVLVA